jgi:hypothetical protein
LPGVGHNPLIESPEQLAVLLDAALSYASYVSGPAEPDQP